MNIMENLKFKTNIKCNGCLQTVKPYLDNISDLENWNVDLENPDKILSVNTKVDAEESIIVAVKAAGYEISKIKS